VLGSAERKVTRSGLLWIMGKGDEVYQDPTVFSTTFSVLIHILGQQHYDFNWGAILGEIPQC
jgi:hypothetical protein